MNTLGRVVITFLMHQEMYSVQNTDELIECDIVFQTTNKSDINGPEV